METDISVSVTEPSQVGEVRRRAQHLAEQLGFAAAPAGAVALVVTEIAKNITRHAEAGNVILHALERDGVRGVEVLAYDRGPGIQSLAAALRDGYSTAGGPGKGLGAIRRLSTQFDIYSSPGVGTAVGAQLWARPLPASRQRLEIAGICQPAQGESVSGDAWAVREVEGKTTVMVVDGLGHGLGAVEASRQALAAMSSDVVERGPAALVQVCHQALRSTRGAALAAAELRLGRGEVRYCGVGNIAGFIWDRHESRGLASRNGIVGHQAHTFSEYVYAWQPGSLLVLYSDGLSSKLSLERYPGLASHHPSVIAATLFRDYCRGRDDATIVCVKAPESEP